jgi:predicted ATP-binding protein involved in virulence
MPKIVIPRLRRLRIEDYELYPPYPAHGVFDRAFQPGVSVIVGINGLGKTKLLNLIFRTLVALAAELEGAGRASMRHGAHLVRKV